MSDRARTGHRRALSSQTAGDPVTATREDLDEAIYLIELVAQSDDADGRPGPCIERIGQRSQLARRETDGDEIANPLRPLDIGFRKAPVAIVEARGAQQSRRFVVAKRAGADTETLGGFPNAHGLDPSVKG